MSAFIYIVECMILCAAFSALVLGLCLSNPVSFISDYPPEIQARYYKTQHKEAEKGKLTILMLIKKLVALVCLLFLFAWMAHAAGAKNFSQALLCAYGYVLVLFAFDTFFIDWVLFPRIRRFRLPGTENMDREYRQKWFHVKACIPVSPVAVVAGVVIAGVMCWIW